TGGGVGAGGQPSKPATSGGGVKRGGRETTPMARPVPARTTPPPVKRWIRILLAVCCCLAAQARAQTDEQAKAAEVAGRSFALNYARKCIVFGPRRDAGTSRVQEPAPKPLPPMVRAHGPRELAALPATTEALGIETIGPAELVPLARFTALRSLVLSSTDAVLAPGHPMFSHSWGQAGDD